jgi:hypothetical protein
MPSPFRQNRSPARGFAGTPTAVGGTAQMPLGDWGWGSLAAATAGLGPVAPSGWMLPLPLLLFLCHRKPKTESGCHTPRPICVFVPPREAGAWRFFPRWQVRDFPTKILKETVCVVLQVYRNVRVWSCVRRWRREPPSATSSRRTPARLDHVRCDQRSKSAMDYLSPDASAPDATDGPFFSRAAPC